jgi:hypothetical protein
MIVFCHSGIFAQQKISDRMFQELRKMDEITYLSFSKNLIDFVDFDLESDNGDDNSEITGDLYEVKLVVFNPDFKPKMSFRDLIVGHLNKGKYNLIEDDDQGDDTEVWVYRKGLKIHECHVIFQGETNGVMLSFFGDFKVKDIRKFKDKMEEYKD